MPKESSLKGLITVQQMKRLVDDGKTDKEIGEMYYVSPSTVYKFRKKYGLSKHREKVSRDVESYKRMKECLLTDEQVAYIWNMSRRSLTEWKSRENVSGMALQKVDVYADGTPVNEVIMRKGKNLR